MDHRAPPPPKYGRNSQPYDDRHSLQPCGRGRGAGRGRGRGVGRGSSGGNRFYDDRAPQGQGRRSRSRGRYDDDQRYFSSSRNDLPDPWPNHRNRGDSLQNAESSITPNPTFQSPQHLNSNAPIQEPLHDIRNHSAQPGVHDLNHSFLRHWPAYESPVSQHADHERPPPAALPPSLSGQHHAPSEPGATLPTDYAATLLNILASSQPHGAVPSLPQRPPPLPPPPPPLLHMPLILGTGMGKEPNSFTERTNQEQIALLLEQMNAAANSAHLQQPIGPVPTVVDSAHSAAKGVAPVPPPRNSLSEDTMPQSVSMWPSFDLPQSNSEPEAKFVEDGGDDLDMSAIVSPTPKRPRTIKSEPASAQAPSPKTSLNGIPYSPSVVHGLPPGTAMDAGSFSPLPLPYHSPALKPNTAGYASLPSLDIVPQGLYHLAYADQDEQVMGVLASLETARLEGVATVHLVKGYLCHPAAWIRRAALQALHSLSESLATCPLDPCLYPWLHPLLADKDTHVRTLTILVLRILANADPTFVVPISAALAPSVARTRLTLADDAFIRIAALVHDPVRSVRQAATLALGDFAHVSGDLALQTLSKKLAASSNATTKRHAPIQLSAEWMPFAGAFVHAMEDEFQEVRHAALDAIARLAAQHARAAFAHEAIGFLLDMTNDEVAGVRTRALQVLIEIAEKDAGAGGVGPRVELGMRDLDDMADLFVDPSTAVRADVYRFLGAVRYVDAVALGRVVVELRKSLDRYSNATATDGGAMAGDQSDEEHTLIMVCLRGIAERNADLVAAEASNILKLSPKFLRREARPTDVHHAALVVLVYNAALQNQAVMRTIPVFIRRQVNLIRHRYPGCIPTPNGASQQALSNPTASSSGLSLGTLSLALPTSTKSPNSHESLRSMASLLYSALCSVVSDAVPSTTSTHKLGQQLAMVRTECIQVAPSPSPASSSVLAALQLLLDLGTLVLDSTDATTPAPSLRQAAAHLAWRYCVATKHVSGGASASWRATSLTPRRTPATSPSLRPTSPHDLGTPVLAARHRTYSLSGAGSVRSRYTNGGGGGKSIWPTLWVDVIHGMHPAEHVLDAVRRALDIMDVLRGVTRMLWALTVQYRHVATTRMGANGLVVVPPGLPLELQVSVSPAGTGSQGLGGHLSFSSSPSLVAADGNARTTGTVTGNAKGLHMHGWPVVVRVTWPHGAVSYLAFRGRPSTTTEGEQHALVRVGPRSWSGPSSVGVVVGWLVGGNRAQDIKLEDGMSGDLGDQHGVEFVPVTNSVQVQVRFL